MTVMEETDALAARIAAAAFAWLRERRVATATGSTPRDLALRPEWLVPIINWYAVIHCVGAAYGLETDFQLLSELQLYFQTTPDAILPAEEARARQQEQAASAAVTARVHHEFTRPYLGGTLPRELENYISRCATATTRVRWRLPMSSLAQSSGFGKSRVLRELANNTRGIPDGRMRVLYTCVRSSAEARSGYPLATACWRDYLFPSVSNDSRTSNQSMNARGVYDYARELYWRGLDWLSGGELSEQARDVEATLEDQLVGRLFRLYSYAVLHWRDVGDEWFQLFDNQDDSEICHRVMHHGGHNAPQSGSVRTLVLAIDEARYLLTKTTEDSNNWFERLRRALKSATPLIRARFGPFSQIFVVLVDSSSRVTNIYPPIALARWSGLAHHSGYRGGETGVEDTGSVLFPPFVLTHTMDIRFKALAAQAKRGGLSRTQFYQRLVGLDYEEAWGTLVSMGRPLWDRVTLDTWDEKAEPWEVIQMAASKLLGGYPADKEESFREESLFGVASVLCRAGVRPHSWSPFASRAIADFMAVLVHTNFTHDQLLSTYSSDPILTFGAAHIWYGAASNGNDHAMLAKFIFPQFRKLLRQEVVDTGGVGELVSRLMLLLAMDATAIVGSDHPAHSKRGYAGRFYPVKVFLEVLYGSGNVKVLNGFRLPDPASASAVHDMLKGLNDWYVGFSHFVYVAREPDEEMLWAMLARRAAGIFPRNFEGVDLFIPIFNGETVSMILVQVKNRTSGDPSFPASASILMRPKLVFSNEFKERKAADVVRIYMNLRGTNPKERNPFYLVDSGVWHSPRTGSEPTSEKSYVLCLEGLSAWNATSKAAREIPVVTSDIASELQKLVKPWWTVEELVDEDLEQRGERFGILADVVCKVASRPLVSSLLDAWSDDSDAGEINTAT